jgi:glycyl-tRNA synthetase beta chain
VLAEAIPAIVRAFPWPKSMRWGAASISTESPRWVRPLQGIVAMLDEELIDFEIGDVRSSAATIGHRFHHPGRITLAGASDYLEKLRACHVVVDPEERAQIIREGAAARPPPRVWRSSRMKAWSRKMPASPNGRCPCSAASTPPSSKSRAR